MMNKKAVAYFGVISALFIFIAGALFIEHYKDNITLVRSDLDCTNSTGISDGTKITCLEIDLLLPYFILTLLSILGGVLTSKVT